MNKSIFQSRTFWVNAITTMVSALTAVGGQSWVTEHPKVVAGIGVAIGVGNIILRVITTEPVSIT